MKFRVSEKKCTGCQLCQMACSAVKEGNYSLKKARIHISFPLKEKGPKIVVCRQCKKCRCMEACQYGAFKKDERTGALYVDCPECQACYACLDACPFGAVTLHLESGLPVVCDLCGGDFYCAEVCGSGAIQRAEALSNE
jgi:anaerobic carbon-monoxide dehydrogenase iron sulfur subunit